MNSVISALASKVSPEALNTPALVGLKVGHINHGAAIYSTFVAEADKQGLTQMETIREIALTSKLSCVEFAAAVKAAQEMADATDKANGFVKPVGAKGQDNYGPKRRLLNQRASEAKQLFGVFKLQPQLLQEKGYWQGLSDARDYLSALSLKWDNTPVLSSDAKAANKAGKVEREALADVMATNAMQEGETRAQYLDRIDQLAEDAIDAAKTEAFNKVVKTTIDSLTEKHGHEMLLAIAVHAIQEIMDDAQLQELQAQLNEMFKE